MRVSVTRLTQSVKRVVTKEWWDILCCDTWEFLLIQLKEEQERVKGWNFKCLEDKHCQVVQYHQETGKIMLPHLTRKLTPQTQVTPPRCMHVYLLYKYYKMYSTSNVRFVLVHCLHIKCQVVSNTAFTLKISHWRGIFYRQTTHLGSASGYFHIAISGGSNLLLRGKACCIGKKIVVKCLPFRDQSVLTVWPVTKILKFRYINIIMLFSIMT